MDTLKGLVVRVDSKTVAKQERLKLLTTIHNGKKLSFDVCVSGLHISVSDLTGHGEGNRFVLLYECGTQTFQ